MSAFVDQLLVRFSDPAQLLLLLDPVADTTHERLKALLQAAYVFDFATLHAARDASVLNSEFERPILNLLRNHETRTQSVPSYTREDIIGEAFDPEPSVWLDISAQVSLTAVLEIDNAEVASIVTREITGFNTLADFESRFQFIDSAALFADLGVANFAELKERYHHFLTEVQLQPLPAFNPADPANARRLTLGVAILIRDTLDVAEVLREAKTARQTMESSLTYRRNERGVDVKTPYAVMLIFPQAIVAGLPFSLTDLQRLLAAEDILGVPVTP